MSETQTARVIGVLDMSGDEFRYAATHFDTSHGDARIFLNDDLVGVHASGTWRNIFFLAEDGDE